MDGGVFMVSCVVSRNVRRDLVVPDLLAISTKAWSLQDGLPPLSRRHQMTGRANSLRQLLSGFQ